MAIRRERKGENERENDGEGEKQVGREERVELEGSMREQKWIQIKK